MSTTLQRPVRVGVFTTVTEADRAVQGLLSAGFTKEQISVVCSNKVKESFFPQYQHDKPAGEAAPTHAAAGGLAGLIAGGLIATTGIVATGGLGLLVIGGLLAGTGAAVGTFVGAMTSRGVEHEVANFYDQALSRGEILVAAEITDDSQRLLLDVAETVFRDAGAQPLKLQKG